MEKKKEDIRQGNISLILNSYDDIFSSFDPRFYSEKALSSDFIEEAKRAARDKNSGEIGLKLLIPKAKRELHKEKIIDERLKTHFKKHYQELEGEKKSILKQGTLFFIVGIIFMFILTFVLFTYEKSAIINFLIILLEPASWFLFWEGLNLIIFSPKKIKSELEFYRKMSNCNIEFDFY